MKTEIPTPGDLKRLWAMFCGRTLIGPKYVMVDIINDCDLHCPMCFNHSPLLKKSGEYEMWKSTRMNYDTFALLLADLFKIKTEFVGICGEGEPFLHPDIKKILSLITKYKFKGHIMTNGIHIDKETLDCLIKMKLERLTFSIHARNNKAYKLIHPLAEDGLFDHLRENLMYLKMKKNSLKSKFPKVTIINVISRLNYDNLFDMIRFAQKVGAGRICFKPLVVKDETKETLYLEAAHINQIKTDLKVLRQNIKLEHNVEEFLGSLDYSGREVNQSNPLVKNRICYLPWVRANITTEGRVIGCVYQEKSYLGDITKTSFKEIWNNREYIEFRRNKLCPQNCLGEAVYPFVNIINSINRIKNRLIADDKFDLFLNFAML